MQGVVLGLAVIVLGVCQSDRLLAQDGTDTEHLASSTGQEVHGLSGLSANSPGRTGVRSGVWSVGFRRVRIGIITGPGGEAVEGL